MYASSGAGGAGGEGYGRKSKSYSSSDDDSSAATVKIMSQRIREKMQVSSAGEIQCEEGFWRFLQYIFKHICRRLALPFHALAGALGLIVLFAFSFVESFQNPALTEQAQPDLLDYSFFQAAFGQKPALWKRVLVEPINILMRWMRIVLVDLPNVLARFIRLPYHLWSQEIDTIPPSQDGRSYCFAQYEVDKSSLNPFELFNQVARLFVMLPHAIYAYIRNLFIEQNMLKRGSLAVPLWNRSAVIGQTWWQNYKDMMTKGSAWMLCPSLLLMPVHFLLAFSRTCAWNLYDKFVKDSSSKLVFIPKLMVFMLNVVSVSCQNVLDISRQLFVVMAFAASSLVHIPLINRFMATSPRGRKRRMKQIVAAWNINHLGFISDTNTSDVDQRQNAFAVIANIGLIRLVTTAVKTLFAWVAFVAELAVIIVFDVLLSVLLWISLSKAKTLQGWKRTCLRHLNKLSHSRDRVKELRRQALGQKALLKKMVVTETLYLTTLILAGLAAAFFMHYVKLALLIKIASGVVALSAGYMTASTLVAGGSYPLVLLVPYLSDTLVRPIKDIVSPVVEIFVAAVSLLPMAVLAVFSFFPPVQNILLAKLKDQDQDQDQEVSANPTTSRFRLYGSYKTFANSINFSVPKQGSIHWLAAPIYYLSHVLPVALIDIARQIIFLPQHWIHAVAKWLLRRTDEDHGKKGNVLNFLTAPLPVIAGLISFPLTLLKGSEGSFLRIQQGYRQDAFSIRLIWTMLKQAEDWVKQKNQTDNEVKVFDRKNWIKTGFSYCLRGVYRCMLIPVAIAGSIMELITFVLNKLPEKYKDTVEAVDAWLNALLYRFSNVLLYPTLLLRQLSIVVAECLKLPLRLLGMPKAVEAIDDFCTKMDTYRFIDTVRVQVSEACEAQVSLTGKINQALYGRKPVASQSLQRGSGIEPVNCQQDPRHQSQQPSHSQWEKGYLA
jgi:hypothetical protein